MDNLHEKLEELRFYSNKLSEKQFVIGPGGNTSLRIGENLYIKPSGLTFDEMEANDFVEVHIDSGEITKNQKRTKPSSEILMHRYIYQVRPEVNCIFHAHPPITVGLAAVNAKFKHLIPDSVAYLGKEILVLDYIVPTTNKLAEYVRDNIQNHHLSIVLKNHGAITVADNVKTAYLRMELLESLAYTLWIARSAKGKDKIRYLTEEEMEEIVNLDAEKYRTKLFEPKK